MQFSSRPRLSTLALSIPVAMGYVPLGMVFGFLLAQAGAAWWLAPFASLFVFAGAAQFMAVPMLAAGVPVGAIALATFIVNLRHIFYGLSLLDRLPKNRWARAYLVWALTDENYSVITTLPQDAPAAQFVRVAALNHGWWILGSAIGAIAGSQMSLALTGIDFALAALFAVLTIEQWRAAKRLTPILVAVVAYALSWGLTAWLDAPSQTLVVAIALSLTAGLALSKKENVR
jgi:4-azaleucine resistance transporter AzlC